MNNTVQCGLASVFLLGAVGCASSSHWYKGNTHTHTLWSDGDAAPELAVDWYAGNGYDFLVLSEHNVFLDHERWFAVTQGGRLRPGHVEQLVARFGPEALLIRETDEGGIEMRLKTLPELRAMFEEGRFVLVSGEEVTDQFENSPVHINAINNRSLIEPQHGGSVLETIANNLDAINAHAAESGHPTLAHINHPNFGWGITADELAAIEGDRFFEVYNGHQSVRNYGDADHPSLESMWDQALAHRLTTTGELLYGLATDDAHNHHNPNGHSVPGRGWVMVRADRLEADELVLAMKRGDFYSSSGVRIRGIEIEHEGGGTEYGIEIDAEPGVSYTTEFIGTRRMADGSLGPVGEVLHTTDENPAEYEFDGKELYVRARVLSSKPHPRPYAEGDLETAWLQPVVPSGD